VEFRRELVRRIQSGETESDAVVTATGHSLGGGLAQHFAYSYRVPGDPDVTVARDFPRISTMTVFDPSPVTGWTSLPWKTRGRNAEGLTIDRVFEHGEVLSYVRLLTSLASPPSERDPAIREIRFNFDPSVNFIENHSMNILADGLQKAASGQGDCSR
jgi:pimeloyl-ACP methyl ester carboxylesterase